MMMLGDDFNSIQRLSSGIDVNLDDEERITFYAMLKKPKDFSPDRIKNMITPENMANLSDADRSGEKKYLCAFREKIKNEVICCYAPLILYAVFFRWETELALMLDHGFAVSEDMLFQAENRGTNASLMQLNFHESKNIGIIELLLNRRIDHELLLKCMERMTLERDFSEYAPIFIQKVFLDEEMNGLKDDVFKAIPPVFPKRSCLSENLLFLHEKAPQLFAGKKSWSAGRNLPMVNVLNLPMTLFLDVMCTFMEIYQGQAKKRESVMVFARDLMDALYKKTESGLNDQLYYETIFGEIDETSFAAKIKQLERLAVSLDALCSTAREKDLFRKLWTGLMLTVYAAYEEFFKGNRVISPQIQKLFHAIPFENAKQLQDCFEEKFFKTGTEEARKQIQIAKVYRILFGEKFVIRLELKKACTFVNKMPFFFPEVGFYAPCDDIPWMQTLTELMEEVRFEYGSADTPTAARLTVLEDIVKFGQEELVRACIKNGLINCGFAGQAAGNLIDQEEAGRRIVPLLLLKKYEMV